MRRISAMIQPPRVDDVCEALLALDITDLTVTEAHGFGRQKGHTTLYPDTGQPIDLLPKTTLRSRRFHHQGRQYGENRRWKNICIGNIAHQFIRTSCWRNVGELTPKQPQNTQKISQHALAHSFIINTLMVVGWNPAPNLSNSAPYKRFELLRKGAESSP